MSVDIGRATSNPLVEVRTVLSRAVTALEALERHDGEDEWSRFTIKPGKWVARSSKLEVGGPCGGKAEWIEGEYIPHPDYARMVAALEEVVELLLPWKRTGLPLKVA